ncbi:MAG: quinone oxidoreductase family protein [Leadbetterella sp.]
MKALTFDSFGSPEVLVFKDVPFPVLKNNEVLVKMEFIGLNFADIYRRKGNYHLKGSPPFIAGYEGSGHIVDCNGHSEYSLGAPICFADVPFANAEYVAVPTDHIIPIPNQISLPQACTILLQGLTAQYLSEDSHKVKENEVILIHAAAGGVGQLLTQICKSKKATVIGLSTSQNKLKRIVDQGADYAILLDENWTENIKEITRNEWVDVVYDSIGNTLQDSFSVTKTCGKVVFYGMSGGNPPPVDPRMLMDSSKTLVGGDLWSYLTSKEERIKRSTRLFEWLKSGIIKPTEPTILNLADGKLAHQLLESGNSTGKILLQVTNHTEYIR